jgi:hypothetical protein
MKTNYEATKLSRSCDFACLIISAFIIYFFSDFVIKIVSSFSSEVYTSFASGLASL